MEEVAELGLHDVGAGEGRQNRGQQKWVEWTHGGRLGEGDARAPRGHEQRDPKGGGVAKGE